MVKNLLGENAPLHGDVVEGALDVGQKLILPQRVPATVVGVDGARLKGVQNLADATLDGARRTKVEQVPYPVERHVVVAQIGVGRRHDDLGTGDQVAHAI